MAIPSTRHVIPYTRHCVEEDDVQAVAEVLRGDWLTQGPAVRALEEGIAAACDAPFAVAFSSGTAALHGAAFAAGVGPGDELVTSAITFAGSANCGAYLGATPRFADIDPATWNVNAATVGAVLGERTRLVVPVHLTGLPAPTAEIRAAVGDGVAILEDAAHALGAHTPDGPVGNCRHSDMTMFSLHPSKTIAAGEGGVVTTRDPALRERLECFRNHGFTKRPDRLRHPDEGGWYHEQHDLGFNYRLSDVHSALAGSQLGKMERFLAARNAVADRYREQLAGLDALDLPPAAPPGTRHAYHLFVVRVSGGAQERRRLYDALHAEDILVQVHYIPVYRHPYYADRDPGARAACPEAERYYAQCLSLPCFPALTPDDQQRVVAVVRESLTR